MRKALIAIMAIAMIAAVASCNRKRVIDPIHGTVPVDTTWWSGTPSSSDDGEVITSPSRFPLEEFHQLGQAGDTAAQRKLVNDYRKHLTTNVVSHYRGITSHKNVRFVLASGFAKDVKSGDGKTYSGNFRNELLILINDPQAKDTVFLACGNGLLSEVDFDSFEYYLDFGTASPWKFTILPGQGLAHHISDLQEWGEVASNLCIPIKDQETGKLVTKEKYLSYFGQWETVLYPYDEVDVINGIVHNQKGQEVQFDRRLAETEKANAEAAKAKRRNRR